MIIPGLSPRERRAKALTLKAPAYGGQGVQGLTDTLTRQGETKIVRKEG